MSGVLIVFGGVLVLNLYATALVLLRAPLYRVPLYRPMLWNLVLSAAPAVVLALTLGVVLVVADGGPIGMMAVLAVGAIVWCLLLPNSTYLITELNFSHRREGDPVPLWFDIVATLALALSGVMNAIVNVFVAQIIFTVVFVGDRGRHLPFASWVVAAGILFLSTVGIYLGRYIRFNSWDVVRPARFVRALVTHFAVRGKIGEALSFCLLHTLLLAILYVIVAAAALPPI